MSTPESQPVVELARIERAYGRTVALRGADLTVQAGETVAVTGPSGCGKSTLLHVAAGIVRPGAGRVRLLGDDLGALDDAARTRLRRAPGNRPAVRPPRPGSPCSTTSPCRCFSAGRDARRRRLTPSAGSSGSGWSRSVRRAGRALGRLRLVAAPEALDVPVWLGVALLAGLAGAVSGAAVQGRVVTEPLGVRRRDRARDPDGTSLAALLSGLGLLLAGLFLLRQDNGDAAIFLAVVPGALLAALAGGPRLVRAWVHRAGRRGGSHRAHARPRSARRWHRPPDHAARGAASAPGAARSYRAGEPPGSPDSASRRKDS